MRTLNWATWATTLAALATLALMLPGAEAGIFFNRKEKPAPAVQVMEFLKTLRNNPNAGERADAAEALRDFDAQAFPEIVPALINALQHDSSSSVRKQAAESLGKIKPTSVEAEQALEQAESQDDAILVRWKARTALLGYRVQQPAAGPARQAVAPPPQPAPARPQVAMPPPQPAPPPVIRVIPAQSPAITAQPTKQMPSPARETPKPAGSPSPPPPSAPAETGPILQPRRATPASLSRPVAKPSPPPASDGPILIPPSGR